MTLDANSLLLSLLFSSIGFVFFAYGKKQTRAPQMIAGVALMVYPYFVTSLLWMTVVGSLLIGLMWLAIRLGV